jgi:pyruvate/2-oxoacid:ferredoxin oxidoreductase alpha subunit
MMEEVDRKQAVPLTMDVEITREVTNSISKLKLGDSGRKKARDDDDTKRTVEKIGLLKIESVKADLSDCSIGGELQDDEVEEEEKEGNEERKKEERKRELTGVERPSKNKDEKQYIQASLTGKDDEEDVIVCWGGNCIGQESVQEKEGGKKREMVRNKRKLPMTDVEKRIIGKALYARDAKTTGLLAWGVIMLHGGALRR